MSDIRTATSGDLPAIEAIVEAAYAPYIPRMGKKPGPMLDDYAALIRDKRVSVVDVDGKVAGILVLLPLPDALLLDNVAVPAWAQGKGIGKALIAFAEAEARGLGHNRIRLYTHVTMTENVAIYMRLGYVETHRVEEKGFSRVYMEKTLA